MAIIDSSPIPLPIPGSTDLLLLWLVAHRGNPWLLTACAIAGGVIGGYCGWRVGKKGGEEALSKRVSPRLLEPVRRWVAANPLLSVFVPALLPPPVLLSPFVLAAGALGVTRRQFLLAFGGARAIRYSLVAWLGATYGRHMVRVWSKALDEWSAPIAWTFASLVVAGILFAVMKTRRQRSTAPAGRVARESAAD